MKGKRKVRKIIVVYVGMCRQKIPTQKNNETLPTIGVNVKSRCKMVG